MKFDIWIRGKGTIPGWSIMATSVDGDSPQDAIIRWRQSHEQYRHVWPSYIWDDCEWKAMPEGVFP